MAESRAPGAHSYDRPVPPGAAEWEFEAILHTDETASHTFEESGLYEYYCEHHGEANECGVVVVGDEEPPDLLPCDPQA